MSDEAKVRDLFESVARPIDVDGRIFKADRERAVATILKAAEDAPLRRPGSRSRWLLGMGLAASLALAASAILALRGHEPASVARRSLSLSQVHGLVTLQAASGNIPLVASTEARAISATTSLVTDASSGARLRSSDGLDIALFENSRLSLVGLSLEDASNVQLLAGSIHCEVPALAKGRQFSVATPDATIVVHGTAFSVIVSGIAAAARTCVKVEHGEVLVRARTAERLLVSGESWGCTSDAPALPPGAQPIGTGAPAATSSAKPTKPKERAVDKPLGGTLDEENRLFQAGLAAERVGDFRTATQSLEQLLAAYPASPLAADARLALSRVKSHLAPVP